MNHQGFKRRMEIVRKILEARGLKASSIDPVQYDKDCPFWYNNFIYKVDLDGGSNLEIPVRPSNDSSTGSQDIHAATTTLILRISNPLADGLNNTNRVQNEVASMRLARSALAQWCPALEEIVPEIFAWQAAKDQAQTEEDFGWILMDYRPGVPLDSHLDNLPVDSRANIMGQIADIVSALQKCQLPDGVTAHGGLTIDPNGRIVSAEMATLRGGPWREYRSFWQAKLQDKIAEAEKSPVVEGWMQDGLHERINRFLDQGLGKALGDANVDMDKKVLIHGDLTTNNILFNPANNRLTGLVDFDFAFVSHPAHEFFTSLHDLGGNTSGCYGPDPTNGKLRAAILSGQFEWTGAAEEDQKLDQADTLFAHAMAWSDALRKSGGLRPCDLAGISTLDRLNQLEHAICPFQLVHPVFVKRKTPEELETTRRTAAQKLDGILRDFGW